MHTKLINKLKTMLYTLSLGFVSLVFCGLFPQSAYAQDTGVSVPVGSFVGQYFNNANLTGSAFVRNDSAINFNWGGGSPDQSIRSDYFSARWLGDFSFTDHWYEFSTTSDDGVRVYVDDALVVDRWKWQVASTQRQKHFISGGTHRIKVDYFEAEKAAIIGVSWVESDAPITPTPLPTVAPDNSGSGTSTGSISVSSRSVTIYQSYCSDLHINQKEGIAPLTVEFTAVGYDQTGGIVGYKFDFGDVTNGQHNYLETKSAVVKHIYTTPGTYLAYVYIKDARGEYKGHDVNCREVIVVKKAGSTTRVEAINTTLTSANVDELPETGSAVELMFGLFSFSLLGLGLFVRFKVA